MGSGLCNHHTTADDTGAFPPRKWHLMIQGFQRVRHFAKPFVPTEELNLDNSPARGQEKEEFRCGLGWGAVPSEGERAFLHKRLCGLANSGFRGLGTTHQGDQLGSGFG